MNKLFLLLLLNLIAPVCQANQHETAQKVDSKEVRVEKRSLRSRVAQGVIGALMIPGGLFIGVLGYSLGMEGFPYSQNDSQLRRSVKSGMAVTSMLFSLFGGMGLSALGVGLLATAIDSNTTSKSKLQEFHVTVREI